jgi:cytochrome c oxidase cbb3-type subunit 1
MQGLMWRAVNPDGTLTYTFVEGVKATYPYYVIRFGGGLMYLSGMCLMAYNTWLTMRGTASVDARIPSLQPHKRVTTATPEHA